MKIQKKTIIPFLTPQNVKDGDVVVIKSEGELVDTPSGVKRYRFEVEKDGQPYLWTMNQNTVNRLVDSFGDETENWVNKQVKLRLALVLVRGQEKLSIVGEPVNVQQNKKAK